MTREDIDVVYGWRNDPSTRELMFDTDEIQLDTHRAFWNWRFYATENADAWIIIDGDERVGVIRIDPEEEGHQVDLIVAPQYRGKGIGTEALKLFDKERPMNWIPLIAWIKPENIASKKAFRNAGFVVRYEMHKLGD
jgi:RimJ/RimL family protein N-acetyltransferase